MNDPLELVSVPMITSLVFLAMYMYNILIANNKKLRRLTPVFAIILGCILGLIAFYGAENVLPATNVLSAILVGGASGLAATGSHQIYKQLFCTKDDEEDTAKTDAGTSGLQIENTAKTDEKANEKNDEKSD